MKAPLFAGILLSALLTLPAPEAFAISDGDHRSAVQFYKDTVNACVGRNAQGNPTLARLVTVNLKRLQWSYDSWMDKVWGKPKSDGFFASIKRSEAYEAHKSLTACADQGDPSATMLNNYNVEKIQAEAKALRAAAVTETRKIAKQVGAVNPKDAKCKAATDKHVEFLDTFANAQEQITKSLVEVCTRKVVGAAATKKAP